MKIYYRVVYLDTGEIPTYRDFNIDVECPDNYMFKWVYDTEEEALDEIKNFTIKFIDLTIIKFYTTE